MLPDRSDRADQPTSSPTPPLTRFSTLSELGGSALSLRINQLESLLSPWIHFCLPILLTTHYQAQRIYA